LHPDIREKEETVCFYFENVFNTEFNKKQWEEWKKRRITNE